MDRRASDAEEMLVTILVAAGKTAEALAIGRGLAARFDVEARRRPSAAPTCSCSSRAPR